MFIFSVWYKLFTEVQYTEKHKNLWSLIKSFTVSTLDNQYPKSRLCKSPSTLSPPASPLYPSFSSPEPSLWLLHHRYCSGISQKYLKVHMIPFLSLLLLVIPCSRSSAFLVLLHIWYEYAKAYLYILLSFTDFCLQISIDECMHPALGVHNRNSQASGTDMLALVDPGSSLPKVVVLTTPPPQGRRLPCITCDRTGCHLFF